MPRVYGVPGKSALAMGDARHQTLLARIVLPMLGCVVLLGLGYLFLTAGNWGAAVVLGAVFMVAISVLNAKGVALKARIRHADTGAEAETVVAEALQALPDRYHVFHDLDFSGFNIDHVVLGPTGLFLVETKSQGGTISERNEELVRNGRRFFKDFVKQCWRQMFALKEYLRDKGQINLPVTPVLCFANGLVETRGPVRGVAVVNVSSLVSYILSRKESVSAASVDACVPFLAVLTGHSMEESVRDRAASVSETGEPLRNPPGIESLRVDRSEEKTYLVPRMAALMLGAVMAYGIYKGAVGLVHFVGDPGPTPVRIAPSTPSSRPPSPAPRPAPATPAPPRPSASFPFTHAVAYASAKNSVPFMVQADHGQHVLLVLYETTSRRLVLRACVRANETLSTMLPRRDLNCVMITGPFWEGMERLFGEEFEARKSLLRVSARQANGPDSVQTTASALLESEAIPGEEAKALVKAAFKGGGGFLKM